MGLDWYPCPHAIKAYIHDKQEPEDHVDWWYSKEAYMLVYMHKIQPVRGSKFWKVNSAHAMEPPEIHKMVGRPKVLRKREKAESRKREGVWSASRKGLKMACGHCGATGHNHRKCPLLNKSTQPVQDVSLSAPLDSQESGVFMPTLDCVASSSQQTSYSTQHTCLSAGSSNPNDKICWSFKVKEQICWT